MPTKRQRGPPDVEIEQPRRRPTPSFDQLARKRASDRDAQRALREKTRSKIAHLESLLSALQGKKEESVELLIRQVNDQRAEITRLKTALGSISKIAYAAKGVEDEAPEAVLVPSASRENEIMVSSEMGHLAMNVSEPEVSDNILREDQSVPVKSFETSRPEQLLIADDSATSLPKLITPTSTPFPSSLADAPSDPSQPSMSLSIAQIASNIVRRTDLDGRFWYLAGTVLNFILKNHQGHAMYTASDDDIAIRAVYEGWSAVIERYPLDLGWQWLKEIDEHIYFGCPLARRLCHLRNCRLQLLHQIDPRGGWNQALPEFFAPRPSQLHVKHDALVEHFPWPGFRERVLFSPRRFATNTFMEAVRNHVHFAWPVDGHMYAKNSATGLYTYSEAFDRHVLDIRSYTADRDFFIEFPELLSDIPHAQPSLNTLSMFLSITGDSPESDEENATPLGVF